MGEEDPAAEEDKPPWVTKLSTPDWEFWIAISLSTSVVCFKKEKKSGEISMDKSKCTRQSMVGAKAE